MNPRLQECFGRYGYGTGWFLDDEEVETDQVTCLNCPLRTASGGRCMECPYEAKPKVTCATCPLREPCHSATDRQTEADYPEECAGFNEQVHRIMVKYDKDEHAAKWHVYQVLSSYGMVDAYSYIIKENIDAGEDERELWDCRN